MSGGGPGGAAGTLSLVEDIGIGIGMGAKTEFGLDLLPFPVLIPESDA